MLDRGIKLTILGSGTSVQYAFRGSASYLLEFMDKKVLLDAGFFVVDRLEKVGVLLSDIDEIFITHKHPDHFMGLIHLMSALKNPFYQRKKQVKIIGFKGLKNHITGFQKILGHWIEPKCGIEISENKKDTIDNYCYEIFDTIHADESVGFILNIYDKKIVYTGDTELFSGLYSIAKDADLLIADCGSSPEHKISGHMDYNEILDIAEIAGVSRVIFSHFYPGSDEFALDLSKHNFEAYKARDLMTLSI